MMMGRILTLSTLSALALFSQNRHKVDINTETPEGQLLQQLGQEQDAAKKTLMLEDFAAKYPKHSSYAWVLGQLSANLIKSQQWDKVFPVAQALVGFDAADSEMAYSGLQAAVAKNDPTLIAKWAAITNDAAKKGAARPKPANEDEEAMWEYQVKFSQQVQERCEYEVYTAGLRQTDPAKRIEMLDALGALNPKSKYAVTSDDAYILAYRQLGANDKALAVAEKADAANTANEDMYLLLANGSFEKKENDKVVAYSDKLVALLKDKAAPQGMSPDDWGKKKKTTLGAGYWLKGMVYAGANKFKEADETLREGLPFYEDNEQLLAPALFQLGLANNKLGTAGKIADKKRLTDAVGYFSRCAAIKSPYQTQAATNVKVIRTQYAIK